jgi:hypothetical protein
MINKGFQASPRYTYVLVPSALPTERNLVPWVGGSDLSGWYGIDSAIHVRIVGASDWEGGRDLANGTGSIIVGERVRSGECLVPNCDLFNRGSITSCKWSGYRLLSMYPWAETPATAARAVITVANNIVKTERRSY